MGVTEEGVQTPWRFSQCCLWANPKRLPQGTHLTQGLETHCTDRQAEAPKGKGCFCKYKNCEM